MTGRTSRRGVRWRYILRMFRAALISIVVTLSTAPALAQDFDRTREINALRDSARAQERQAGELRRIRQIEGDRAWQQDRARRNAARYARSSRRFD